MSTTTGNGNIIHFLDDFLETLEGLPQEVRRELEQLTEKDKLYEETKRNLFKKRCLLMKADEKGLDAAMQATLLRKAEKDYAKSLQLIDEKIAIEERLVELIGGHLSRMDQSLDRSLSMTFENAHTNFISDVPDTASYQQQSTNRHLLLLTTRSSPKKRQALNDDEPIDPDEPVYCFCNQVSFGDMIACDNVNCGREWFHYPCVGLEEPPKGKWYCRECEPLMKLQ